MTNSDEHIIEELKSSVEAIVGKIGPHSKFAQDLISRIGSLQTKLDALSDPEKISFINEMKDPFKKAIERIEQRLTTHAYFEQTYSSSIVMAVIFIIVCVCALFGYQLYKSLAEKKLKKEEKLKNKLHKKSKKN